MTGLSALRAVLKKRDTINLDDAHEGNEGHHVYRVVDHVSWCSKRRRTGLVRALRRPLGAAQPRAGSRARLDGERVGDLARAGPPVPAGAPPGAPHHAAVG